MSEYVAVGMVERPHGLRGQIKVRPLTDDPLRFQRLKSVMIEPPEGPATRYEIRSVSIKEPSIYMFLEGVDDRDAAKALSGAYISISKDEVLPLEKDAFYPFEVIGFEVVTVQGENIGIVQNVMDLPANDVLVVTKNGREVLIPVTREVLQKVDRERCQVVIDPIEGLLD